MMYEQYQLETLTIWPGMDGLVKVTLIDDLGQVLGTYTSEEPLRGSEIKPFVPVGYTVEFDGFVARGPSSGMAWTKGRFDTEVVTERPVVGIEERLARVEALSRQQLRLEQQRLEEARAARQKADDQAQVVEDERPAQLEEEVAGISGTTEEAQREGGVVNA